MKAITMADGDDGHHDGGRAGDPAGADGDHGDAGEDQRAETDPVGMSRRAPADAVSALDRRTGWRSRRDGHVRPP